MGLERGLVDVKDELQMFIESQKRKLDNDKIELKNAQAALSPRDQKFGDSGLDGDYSRSYGFSNKGAVQSHDDLGGLPFGEYENKKKAIREEQIKGYKKYAAEKELRRTGTIDPMLLDDLSPRSKSKTGKEESFIKRSQVSTPDIVDAYAALLRKKRAEERIYREKYEDPEVSADSRKVRFHDPENENVSSRTPPSIDDEELFQWARDKAKIGRRQHSVVDLKSEKPPANNIEESKRAKSVPPSAGAGIFGGGMENADASKKRKEQYKKDLETQIKEKEQEKMREKLKRMGRITSKDQLNTAVEKPIAIEKEESVLQVDSQQRTISNRSRGGNPMHARFEEDNINPRFELRNHTPRGGLPYGGMNGYDPYMSMMAGRFDPRMDPYLMQNFGYGAFPGYGGMMYGPNPAMLPRMDRFDERGQDFKGKTTGRHSSHLPKTSSAFLDGFDISNASQRYVNESKHQPSPTTPKDPDRDTSRQDNSRSNDYMAKKKQSPRGKAAVGGVFGDDSTVDKGNERAAKLAYQQELKKQMQEKQAAKEKEKKERERYEAKLEAEIANYDPWGKAGGGAPMKDRTGHLVADLRTLHKFNEDGVPVSPRMQPGANNALSDLPKESPVLAALNGFQSIANASPDVSPRANLHDNPNGRGAALLELQGEQKNAGEKREQQQYQEFLKQQIEEKKRIKLEEERKQKEEEEKESRRLEEQRLKMEQEFLLEQERERRKEEEVRKKNDEMRKVAEQKRYEAERERKEIEEDRFRSIVKRSSEMKQHVIETRSRSQSPPIPTLQGKQPDHSRPISRPLPTIVKQQKAELDEHERPVSRPLPVLTKQTKAMISTESHSTQVSNPSPSRQDDIRSSQYHINNADGTVDSDLRYLKAIREQLLQVNTETEETSSSRIQSQDHVFKQLAALRRQLSNEEHKVQVELEKNVEKYQENKMKSKSKSSNQRSKASHAEIFGKARIRRGSATRKVVPKHADEFNKLADSSSVLDFKSKFPDKPETSIELDIQQKEFIRLQEQKLQALRQAISDTSSYLMLNINNDKSSAVKQRRTSKQSLLESDSKFISMDDRSVGANSRLSTDGVQNRSLDVDDDTEDPYLSRTKTPGSYSMTSQAIQEMAAKNEERLRRLKAESERDVMTPDDPEGIVNTYLGESPESVNRPQTRQSVKSLPSDNSFK